MPPKRAAAAKPEAAATWKDLTRTLSRCATTAVNLAIDKNDPAATQLVKLVGEAVNVALARAQVLAIAQYSNNSGRSKPKQPTPRKQPTHEASKLSPREEQQQRPSLREGAGRRSQSKKQPTTPAPRAAASRATPKHLDAIEEVSSDVEYGDVDPAKLTAYCAKYGAGAVAARAAAHALMQMDGLDTEYELEDYAALLAAHWETTASEPKDPAAALRANHRALVAAAWGWHSLLHGKGRHAVAAPRVQVDADMTEGKSSDLLGARKAVVAEGEPPTKQHRQSYATVLALRSPSSSPKDGRSRSRSPTATGHVSSSDESIACMRCSKRNSTEKDKIMLCETSGCRGALHRSCARLDRVPSGEWRCPGCATGPGPDWYVVGRGGKSVLETGAAAAGNAAAGTS